MSRPQIGLVVASSWSLAARGGASDGASASDSDAASGARATAPTDHVFGDHLTPAERRAVLEHLKTI